MNESKNRVNFRFFFAFQVINSENNIIENMGFSLKRHTKYFERIANEILYFCDSHFEEKINKIGCLEEKKQ